MKTDIGQMLKDQLVTVLTEPKNMLIPYTIFHSELFSWIIFLAECKILNFADVGKHRCTASLHGWPLDTIIIIIILLFLLYSVYNAR